jgi:hypothetical protein
MALILNEHIIDLGSAGIVCFTTESAPRIPLPAHLFGYANFHTPNGDVLDRKSLFTRPIDVDALHTLVASFRKESEESPYTVQSVRGYIDFVGARVAAGYLQMASRAIALGEARVLVTFAGRAGPVLLRIVDVVRNRVCLEETVEDLRARLDIPGRDRNEPFSQYAPHVSASNGDYLLIDLDYPPVLVRCVGERLERVHATLDRFPFKSQMSRSSLFYAITDTNVVVAVPLSAPTGRAQIDSTMARKQGFEVSCASASDRFALGHPKGVIELCDGSYRRTHLLRPIPRASDKDGSAVAFSPNGRYFVMDDAAGTALVDVEEMRVAKVHIPQYRNEHDRHRFNPNPVYRPAWAITDSGGYVLNQQAVTFTPFDSLSWQPLKAYDPDAKTAAPSRSLVTTFESLRRPALALVPSNCETRSKMYGYPRLASVDDWPRHEDRPMLLVCELDLGEAVLCMQAEHVNVGDSVVDKKAGSGGTLSKLASMLAPKPPRNTSLPSQGLLQFWVALDEEDELAIDEMFNPAAYRVVHIRSGVGEPMRFSDSPPVLDAQYLQFRSDMSTYPALDAPVIK